MVRPFRWLPALGAKHAIGAEFPFWGPKNTLCDPPLVVDHEPTKLEWCWPTCGACDAGVAEGGAMRDLRGVEAIRHCEHVWSLLVQASCDASKIDEADAYLVAVAEYDHRMYQAVMRMIARATGLRCPQ